MGHRLVLVPAASVLTFVKYKMPCICPCYAPYINYINTDMAHIAAQAAEFWAMGYEPFPVSAISGSGSGELLDALERQLPKKSIVPEEASEQQ